MKRAALVLFVCLIASPAAAATLTIENLWDNPITFVGLWAGDTELISEDYGIKPLSFVDLAITKTDPLLDRLTLHLPDSLEEGFVFGGLTFGGTCGIDCGWSTGWTDVSTGTIIGLGFTTFSVLWPTSDGGSQTIARVTYKSTPVPEPATWALLAMGGTLLLWRRHQKISPVARSMWPKRSDVSMM